MEQSFKKTAVVVTSTSSIDYLPTTKPDNLHILRLHVITDNGSYLDAEEIKAQEFYSWMMEHKSHLPRSHEPDFNEVSELFLDLSKKGYTDVLVVTICKNLSKTYFAVKEVADIMQNKINVEVFDSGQFSAGETLMAIRAAELIQEGKSMQTVLNTLELMKRNTATYFVLDTLYYLQKNGRLSRTKNFVSSFLKIKPMFRHRAGVLEIVSKVRKTENAIREFSEFADNELARENSMGLGVYCGNHQLYDDFKRDMKGRLQGTLPLTPVIGCHFGPSSVGVAVYYNTNEYLPENYQLIK